jgi:hypothetical protein
MLEMAVMMSISRSSVQGTGLTHLAKAKCVYRRLTHLGNIRMLGVSNSLPFRLKCLRSAHLMISRSSKAAATATTHVTTVVDSSRSGLACIAGHVICLRAYALVVGITWKLVHCNLVIVCVYVCLCACESNVNTPLHIKEACILPSGKLGISCGLRPITANPRWKQRGLVST